MDLEASYKEIDEFLATLSNPKDIEEYLDKWNKPNADLEEGFDGIEEIIEEDNVEIVIDETDEVLEGDDYLDNFVVNFLEGLEDEEDEGIDGNEDEDNEYEE